MVRPLTVPTGILFDLDDTIIDFAAAEEPCAELACREAASRGIMVTTEQFHEALDRLIRQWWSDRVWARQSTGGRNDSGSAARAIFTATLAQIGIDDLDVAERLTERYRALRFAEMRLFPGAIDTLAQLRRHGIRLALVTNGSTESQRMKIERFGLAPYFDYILIGSEFGVSKPDPRIYEAALQAIDCRPTAAWMVGDDLYHDIAAPQQIGIVGIWVDARGVGLAPDAPTKPDHTIRSIRELMKFS